MCFCGASGDRGPRRRHDRALPLQDGVPRAAADARAGWAAPARAAGRHVLLQLDREGLDPLRAALRGARLLDPLQGAPAGAHDALLRQAVVDRREEVPLAAVPASDADVRLRRRHAGAGGGDGALPRVDLEEDGQD
eukprot:415127-Prymnesium_polylepis.1